MATVTKRAIADQISEKAGMKKIVVKTILQEFLNEIVNELARGNRLEFRSFGVFVVNTRAARAARNPRTGIRVAVPSKAVVRFHAGRALKERVLGACSDSARGKQA